MDFDVIPFEDIKGNWKKLGSGSFGNVYKGSYLGIDVAIKEVLPSNEYDVAKYFEREWRLMKEARHPNVVLYLGLSKAPVPDNRIFIISEFIEGGNLRGYIHDRNKPFPWRLRMSFATDIARALAYLHARKCIHRDLKGENLLVTANGRLKITDFGFARIAARNEEEMKRLTFCGTDSYMSPEILLGHEFDLPTDIFSLGVIFCEILARKLADDHTFKRSAPMFTIDADEVRLLASPGCPPDLIKLALDCCHPSPASRPTMVHVLDRLRVIELEVLDRPEADDLHVGSVKFFSGKQAQRPGLAKRIPSFGMGIGQGIRESSSHKKGPILGALADEGDTTPEETSEDEELRQAINGLKGVTLDPASPINQADDSPVDTTSSGTNSTWSTVTAKPGAERLFANVTDSLELAHSRELRHARRPEISSDSNVPSSVVSYTDYSTSVVRQGGQAPPSLSSIITVRAAPATNGNGNQGTKPVVPTDSMLSIDSFHTATSSISIAAATEGGSTIRPGAPSALLHRFTLIKPGGAGSKAASAKSQVPSKSQVTASNSNSSDIGGGWSPFDFFFSSGLVLSRGPKCDLCQKRLGWRPVLECDDCGLRAHIKCGELAPRDCGMREVSRTPPQVGVPLTKVKANAKSGVSSGAPKK